MEATMENDSLKQALALYAQDLGALLPPQEECEEVTFSPRFERRMDWLLRSHKQFYYIFFNTLAKQVVSIILVVLLGLTAVTIGVEAIREPIVELVTEVFERFTAVSFSEPQGQNIQKIEITEPTYVPEGFTPLSGVERKLIYKREYRNGVGGEITYYQHATTEAKHQLNTENSKYGPITIGDLPGFLVESYQYNATSIMFSDGVYTFVLHGDNVSKDELLKMAQSIPVE